MSTVRSSSNLSKAHSKRPQFPKPVVNPYQPTQQPLPREQAFRSLLMNNLNSSVQDSREVIVGGGRPKTSKSTTATKKVLRVVEDEGLMFHTQDKTPQPSNFSKSPYFQVKVDHSPLIKPLKLERGPVTNYACGTCKLPLFTCVSNHRQQQCEQSLFIFKQNWINETSQSTPARCQRPGVIECPRKQCKSKLGFYSWNGIKCNGCSKFVTPGFQILKSRVKVNEKVQGPKYSSRILTV